MDFHVIIIFLKKKKLAWCLKLNSVILVFQNENITGAHTQHTA